MILHQLMFERLIIEGSQYHEAIIIIENAKKHSKLVSVNWNCDVFSNPRTETIWEIVSEVADKWVAEYIALHNVPTIASFPIIRTKFKPGSVESV